ncbi:PD40 domain-containing protein [Streptomyces resistomycificus]|uniref:PD40 domain-containing protein n=1 Tax=Streptomyces resistomycificus TaxID=67356 RepID=UPI000567DA1B|nr:PD40 domain-containing protein [Streptomyces resistomycificus]KUN93388.1 hypothetical protein AQJ84_30080 [Streptomyces resistomycificus]
MSRGSLGAVLLLALAGAAVPSAAAAPHAPHAHAPHTPRVERVSTAADGNQADGPSDGAAISADGRSVAFTSRAASLGCAQFTCLRVKDLATGGLTAIDLGPGYTYGSPTMSADGRFVGFSAGTRFAAPYVHDRVTGRSERLWPQDPPGSAELGGMQAISPDGTHVVYTVGNRNGPQGTRLLYVRDTATGTDELVSPAEEGAKRGASVSGDGRRVAYQVAGSEDDPNDVFVKDRATGERTQADAGLGQGSLVRITEDGHRVLFEAEGRLYAYDLRTGDRRPVAEGSVSAVTADGRYAVVAGEDGRRVRDLRTGARGAVLPSDAQIMPDALAAKGRAVAFGSRASHLVPGDTNGEADVFVFSGGLRAHPAPMPSVTERVSLTATGQQRPGASYEPVMGEDKVVAFTSRGSVDPQDTDVFVHAAGGIAQVDSTAQGPSHEGTPCSSGRMVGYVAPSGTDGGPEIHIRNRSVGKLTTLGSYQGVRFTWTGQPGVDPSCQWITYAATLPATDADPSPQPRVYRFKFNGGTTDVVSEPSGRAAGNPSINHDGRYVAFEQGGDVYVRDLDTGDLEKAGDRSSAPSISADGRRVAFQRGGEVHVRDLDTGTTTRIRGAQPSLAGNGAFVAYTARGAVHLTELATGKRQLISVDRWGGRNDLPARHPSVNADGTVVAFESASPDLVEGDTNGVADVFLRTVQ